MASEVDQIIKTMQSGNHFLLSGGAGSGKTHTLIDLIQRINEEEPKSKIACITYTNVAADEITDRVKSSSLKASTIHDFLWDNIKGFQANLKDAIIELNDDVSTEDLSNDIEIQYREYKSLKKGVISHNEVIQIAKYLFEEHPLLCKILGDKLDYIFVDEYQDTSTEVIEILFKNLNLKSIDLRIGLFGDSMQSIYDKGIGKLNINQLINNDFQRKLTKVEKILNRRNPQSIIDLANELRDDDLKQDPSKNTDAPNINKDGTIKKGNITFLYSSLGDKALKDITTSKYCSDWNFLDFDKKGKPLSKVLFIRNRTIAKHAEFNTLFEIYTKDKIVGKGGYIKRIKDYLKTVDIEYDTDSFSLLELLNKLIKEFDQGLDFKKAIDLIKKEEPNFDTIQKAINSVKRMHPGIEKILPTGAMYTHIIDNSDLFDMALSMPFKDLTKIYLDKEKLIGNKKSKNSESNTRNDEKDALIKYLFKVQEIISLYQDKNINTLLKKVDFKIRVGKDKTVLKSKMDELCSLTTLKIKYVLEYAESSGILEFDSKVSDFITSNDYLLERVNRVDYLELINLYNYTEGLSSYSTQHGVKGEEFDNVLVVINNDKIHQLSICYEYLFEGKSDDEKYFNRTLNLFYVACTRPKEDLIVFYEGECSQKTILKANEWFENVIDLNQINQ
ncbi:ATP-dependent DNA helicase Rep [Kordia antarctica]|uniref:DNA 3'-5' helicase II n=1 Tax=Kordia antarctica TaxID=1218801 RepID=A0A7L4ZJL5_9FLAO|nr:UvrD-helicase domain-containing protein [Kordia antarctica]QHI36396.1 ATP-dependent DNA helicase Rep [Kordia antarctica]